MTLQDWGSIGEVVGAVAVVVTLIHLAGRLFAVVGEAALALARPEGAPSGTKGLALFATPRHLEDGSRNAYRIVRLKDKLGTRSMASGEIRLEGAKAFLVGEAGRGFVQMADMVNNSRLSNGVRAAGLMRRACSEALFVARERRGILAAIPELDPRPPGVLHGAPR